ncbi:MULTISPECIES: hypothetical protein [unclassified Pseudomonas]|uniref:hypothetical protein n=1 Tax=unclassified Pseudomonas TaxID=196821 RepID=UPI0014754B68|nr:MULTISPECIES: hypothetical protein [unclassified Pseudomonas]NMX94386.1 hypothetical protein [Pseudomonas sp. WS 5086]NMY47872.1 hypothetical protein [Pseudomonas sp. WS 5027]
MENTGILHEGQMTDHANKADTDLSRIYNLLKIKVYFLIRDLARALQLPQYVSKPVKELKND